MRSLRRQSPRRGPRRRVRGRPGRGAGGRCRPTTTWPRPRTCTSSGRRRSATPRARPPAAGTASCAPSAGAWCRPGRRTCRSATGCSTHGSSRSPRSRPSRRPPRPGAAWCRPTAGTSGPSGWTPRASSPTTSPRRTVRCSPSPGCGRSGAAVTTASTPARSSRRRPSAALTEIHERMPLVLPPDRWTAWLDPARDDVEELARPTPPEVVEALELRPVSTAVNNVANNGPGARGPRGGGQRSRPTSPPSSDRGHHHREVRRAAGDR